MKRNGLSSNRRLKTERGACAQDRSGFIPSAASTIRRRARQAQLGVAPIKMSKIKIDPTMCMKTNKKMTISPKQKTTFLHNCTPFCREAHVFYRNRRLICHYSCAGERIPRPMCRSSRGQQGWSRVEPGSVQRCARKPAQAGHTIWPPASCAVDHILLIQVNLLLRRRLRMRGRPWDGACVSFPRQGLRPLIDVGVP
jgi:hypothetical protein